MYTVRIKVFFKNVHSFLLKKRTFLSGSVYEYLGVGAIFFVITLVLTNFTLISGGTKLFVDGPGDGTAGFLWFNTVETDANPALGHTDMSNYPEGENLYNPTQVTYTLVWVPLWVLSRILGPVTGLNLVTFMAIFLCAMSMYWLVKRLTKNPMVAFFAGYAAAYTPYHLIKSSSHLTYTFSVVFILILAAFIGYWKNPTAKRAVLLALAVATAFYTDGYFLLLGSVFVACLFMGGILHDILTKQNRTVFALRLKRSFIALGALAVLCVPIGLTQMAQSSGIDKFLSGARGSIQFDIEYYSTKPIDFIIPSPHNPLLENNDTFKSIVAYQNRRSNTSENNTYIGFGLLSLVLVGYTLFLARFLLRKKSHLERYPNLENYKLIYISGLVVLPVLVWCMLSPSISMFGGHITTLATILLQFDVTLWRVMARFYLPLHVMFVVMAALALAVLMHKSLKSAKLGSRVFACIFFVAIFGFTALEYATSLSGNSYNLKNIPEVYYKIRDDNDIKVIAEFPIVDRPLSINYDFATAQLIHKKKLINSPMTNNVPGTRTALGSSIEAVDYAIARGADTIITHDMECADKIWGLLRYRDDNQEATREGAYYGSPICVYKVNSSYKPDHVFAVLQYGTFGDAPFVDANKKQYQAMYMEDGWIRVADQNGKMVTGDVTFSATIGYTPGVSSRFEGRWEVYQEDGVLLVRGDLPGKIEIDQVDASKLLHVRVFGRNGPMPTDQPFTVSLSDIVVAKPTNTR